MSETLWTLEHQISAATACLFFLLGTAFGSFSSVLYHRLPLNQSIWAGRSRCPQCEHQLGAFDLVPLLSYVAMLGRCRHCRCSIHWRYPVLELACGAVSAGAAFFLGWKAGTIALLLWVFIFSLLGLTQKRVKIIERTGSSLVEVLVAGLLFVAVATPAMGSLKAFWQAELLARRRTAMVGLAREAMARAEAAAQSLPSGTPGTACWQDDIYWVAYESTPASFTSPVWNINAFVTRSPECPSPEAHDVQLSGVITGDW